MPAWNAHWISISIDPREDLGVFGFRRRAVFDEKPAELRVRVSADQRYKLFVNGQFVEFGPQRGDVLHWFYETIDLAPYLKAGENWFAALVWNFGRWAPMAQHTIRTGFVFEPLDSRHKSLATPEGWEVARLKNWSFDMMHADDMNFYIDVGPGEIIDFRNAPWGWRTGEDAKGLADWRKAYSVCRAEDRGTKGGMTPWSLIPRSLPSMLYSERPTPPKVRRGFRGDSTSSGPVEQADLSDSLALELGRKYLFDYEELLTAYPRLDVKGPAGTVLVLTYAEGMWQDQGGKGNRNEAKDKKMSGYQDKIVLDGERRTIEPLWWRTYRYLMIEVVSSLAIFRGNEERGEGGGSKGPLVEAGDPHPPAPSPFSGEKGEGVTLYRLSAIETGYPLREESTFEADDPWVKPIWDVSVRTAKRCAGETYFDCPYYEQLQYVGDTRIQALIGYYLGRDRSLTRNAIETLGWSLMENGLTQSRYPSRQPQIIPPFSLWWVMMLWDQILYDPLWTNAESGANVSRYAECAGGIASAFERLMKDPSEDDFWNFGDWVREWGWGVPPGNSDASMHRLTWALVKLALPQISRMAKAVSVLSPQMTLRVEEPLPLTRQDLHEYLDNIRTHDFKSEVSDDDFLLQEDTESARWYQNLSDEHSEALIRLIAMKGGQEPDPWPTEALAKASAAKCTYYFSYYKHLVMFGREDVDKTYRSYKSYPEGQEPQTFDYLTELQPWKEMIENGLSTFAENPEPVRSDCHAWSAHPILGFFQIVAGVTSTAPGWKKARIDPRPGNLNRFKANIAHPDGHLTVAYENERFEIDAPIDFEMRWRGKRQEFKPGRHTIG